MKKIGIISDTHGLLRPEVKENLAGCDAILHAGDIDKPELLDELREIAPVRAVCGNADSSWAEMESLAATADLTLFGLRIYMAHTKKQIRVPASDYDLIITGHSHKYDEKQEKEHLWLNPGTCGPRRRSNPLTIAIVETEEDGTFEVKKIEIVPSEDKKDSGKKSSGKEGEGSSKKDAGKKSSGKRKTKDPEVTTDLIGDVISDVNAGTPVDAIAQRRGISEELAEEICRLYVTHQGIDAEGVLNKMK